MADGRLDAWARARVVVMGDVMLDEFLIGAAERLSPEAPVPVVRVGTVTGALGGAGNAAACCAALGAKTSIVSVTGDDPAGERVRDLLEGAGIQGASCLVDESRPTTTKTRIMAGAQQLARLDREDTRLVDKYLARAVERRVAEFAACSDVMIISDYQKGLVTPLLASAAIKIAVRAGIPVVVDSKAADWSPFVGATVLTPNHHEAEVVSGIRIDSDAACDRAGHELVARVPGSCVLITRGAQGMSLFDGRGAPTHLVSAAREVFDVTGAGDAVVSALAVSLAAGDTLLTACRTANAAAGLAVAKSGTATVHPAELLAASPL